MIESGAGHTKGIPTPSLKKEGKEGKQLNSLVVTPSKFGLFSSSSLGSYVRIDKSYRSGLVMKA